MMRKFPVCTKPWTSLEVRNPDGAVKCCCWLNIHLGNAKKDSLFDIWNNENYRNVRKKMLSGDIDDICPHDCQVLNAPTDSFIRQKHLSYPVLDEGQTEFVQNRKLNIREILDGRTVLSSKPSRLMFHPSDVCNLDCVMCAQVDKKTQADPNARMYKEAESLYPVLEEIKFVGGEPMLDKVSTGIVYGFDSERFPNCRIAMITNGTLLTQHNIDRLLKKTIGWMEISLDAATEATYKRIRIGGNWGKTLAGVQRLLDSCKAQRKTFPILISMVVQKENVCEITQFVELGHRLGVQLVLLWVRGTNELLALEDDLDAPLSAALERAHQIGYTSGILALERLIKNKMPYFEELKKPKAKRDWKDDLIEIDGRLFNSRFYRSYRSWKDATRRLLHSA